MTREEQRLTGGIQTALQMLVGHLERYHDHDDIPENSGSDTQESSLKGVVHHLLGVLNDSDEKNIVMRKLEVSGWQWWATLGDEGWYEYGPFDSKESAIAHLAAEARPHGLPDGRIIEAKSVTVVGNPDSARFLETRNREDVDLDTVPA